MLLCRSTRDFGILFLYPANLLNSLMSSSSFLVVSSGFSMYNIMAFANSNSFTFSLPFQIPFISFFALIAMARTSKIMLNKSGKSVIETSNTFLSHCNHFSI